MNIAEEKILNINSPLVTERKQTMNFNDYFMDCHVCINFNTLED